MTIVGVDGGLSIDHVVRVDEPPHFYSLGGPGLYAALGAKLIEGSDVMLRTGLPRSVQEFGAVLKASGVDVSLCSIVPDVPRVWLLDSPEGRRLVLTAAPNGLEIAAADEAPAWSSVTTPRPYPRLDALLLCSPLRLPADVRRSALVGIDPDQRETRTSSFAYWKQITIPAKSVLLPSRLQLASVERDPVRAVLLLHETLSVPVVARLDSDGAVATDATGTWFVDDVEARVVDTTGAGDAMAGATVAAMASGCDLPTATALGVSAARLVLSAWGHVGLTGCAPFSRPLRGVRTRRRRP